MDRHHHHHHHGRRDDDDEYPPPPRQPPPPFFGGNEPPPPFYGGNEPPPPFYGGNDPPPPFYGGNDPPPPFYGGNEPPHPAYGRHEPAAGVVHTSHHGPGPDHGYPAPPSRPNFSDYPDPPPPDVDRPHHHHHRPHFGHKDAPPHGGDGLPEFAGKPTVKMYCKAETNYSLSIRDGRVILAPADPSDPFQHWIKDERFSTRVKDEEGFPSFALVNKATGQAIKHSTGASHPLQLVPFNPNVLDASVLWTESRDTGENYRAIRMVNNIKLNVDAWNADKDHGGVRDGTIISLWKWTKGDNQRWKIVRYDAD